MARRPDVNLATLLMRYEPDDVLDRLSGSVAGINIERAQASRTLSAKSNGLVPPLWGQAKLRGSETVAALVLIGIILSHHALISAMWRGASKQPFSGKIIRGKEVDGKAYTNFAHVIEELGYRKQFVNRRVVEARLS